MTTKAEPRYEYVRIGLPLPVDVFVTIGDLFNKAWPDAQIIADPAEAGVPREFWPRGREQLIRLDVSRRPKKVSKKTAQDVADGNAPEEGEFVPTTTGIAEDGWVGMTAPEELQAILGDMCHRILDASEGAINYLEWALEDPETGARTVLSVACARSWTTSARMADAQPPGDARGRWASSARH